MGGSTENRVWREIAPYAFIFITAVLLYSKTIAFDFIPSWDDSEYVIKNLYIRSFSMENLKAIFSSAFFLNYAPLQLLTYMAEYQAWGLAPAGYHTTNILLHAINSCLVYSLVRRIIPERRVAFISAMLFAVHPVNVENTAWISERKTLLSALFSMLAVISYIDYSKEGGKARYTASAIFFSLALLSKPVAVVLPFVLFAYELFLGKGMGKGLKKSALKAAPMLVISMIGAFVAIKAQAGGGAVGTETFSPDVLFGTVYPTMLPVFWKYAGLILLPLDQSGFYDTTFYASFFAPVVLVSAIGIIISAVIAFRYFAPAGRFFFLWFWLWLAPVSNIIPLPVFYADRYMYLPALAFYCLFGWAIWRLSLLAGQKEAPVRLILTAAVVIFYATLAFLRADVWKNDLAFWTDTAKKSPNQYAPRLNLGFALEERSMYAEAVREYEAAVRIYPSSEALENLKMARIKRDLKEGAFAPALGDGIIDRAD